MRKLKIKRKNNNLINCALLLIIISFLVIGLNLYKRIEMNRKNKNLMIHFFEIYEEQSLHNKEDSLLTTNKDEVNQKAQKDVKDYIGVLEISEIGLKQGFYSIDSENNDVDKNIKVLNESDMPDIDKGNLLLAAHSGNSSISYFKNLYKLKVGSLANIYYKGNIYNYTLVNTYEIEKSGTAHIVRNANINTLTLITCKKNTNKQLVFIYEVKNK